MSLLMLIKVKHYIRNGHLNGFNILFVELPRNLNSKFYRNGHVKSTFGSRLKH